MNGAKPVLKLLRVHRLPILSQLYLEEALFRNTKDNWCLISDDEAAAKEMMVIKRFTGGGTVVVDHNTIFATLIMS
eukprot:gene90-3697_t